MIIMKRIVFSLCVERTPYHCSYRGRYFYIGAWAALGPEMLRVAGCAVWLHLRVERVGRESTGEGCFFLAGRLLLLDFGPRAKTAYLKDLPPQKGKSPGFRAK